jgi:hypothetical protein
VAQGTRERSIWAWGWRDRFPDDAARAGLSQLVRVLLPNATPVARAAPRDEPHVAASPIAVPDELAGFASQAPRDRAMRARNPF